MKEIKKLVEILKDLDDSDKKMVVEGAIRDAKSKNERNNIYYIKDHATQCLNIAWFFRKRTKYELRHLSYHYSDKLKKFVCDEYWDGEGYMDCGTIHLPFKEKCECLVCDPFKIRINGEHPTKYSSQMLVCKYCGFKKINDADDTDEKLKEFNSIRYHGCFSDVPFSSSEKLKWQNVLSYNKRIFDQQSLHFVCENCMWPKNSEFVYIMQCGVSGLIKIGKSCNPIARNKSIQGMSPTKIELLAMKKVRSMDETERQLHNFFAKERRHGEWFDLSPSIAYKQLIEFA